VPCETKRSRSHASPYFREKVPKGTSKRQNRPVVNSSRLGLTSGKQRRHARSGGASAREAALDRTGAAGPAPPGG
jgi:hypothetical protein